jgi:hypothetical protein
MAQQPVWDVVEACPRHLNRCVAPFGDKTTQSVDFLGYSVPVQRHRFKLSSYSVFAVLKSKCTSKTMACKTKGTVTHRHVGKYGDMSLVYA